MLCMNSTGSLEVHMLPGQMGEEACPDPQLLPLVSKRNPWLLQRSMPNWSAPWGHPTFHQEHTITITGDTDLVEGVANVWSPDKKPRLSSVSIVKHKDLMMKSTLMAPNERESGGNGGHQPPFPEWWDNLPPTVQKTARQQRHLCSCGNSHQSGTELLPTYEPSPSRCGGLHGRDLYLVKPTLGQPKTFQRLTRVPYLVPMTTYCLSPLWPNTEHLPYVPGMCSGAGMSWRILHSWLVEYSLWDNSRDLWTVEFLWEAWFFFLMWVVRHSIHLLTWITPDLMEFVNFI